jgi:hypothetical protein
MCELGRIDILCSVVMLSHRLAMPREWYLDQCFHMFGYLKRHNRWTMVFDETEPNIELSRIPTLNCWDTSRPLSVPNGSNSCLNMKEIVFGKTTNMNSCNDTVKLGQNAVP